MQKPNILIVDDEPENIRILAKALKMKYTVMAVTRGEDALEHAMSENRPDIILLDIMMPGMNGYEVCRRLKAERATRDIPVIFITALNEDENETRGLEAGAVDFIRKPFNPDITEARVRTHLELRRYSIHLEELAEQRARQIVHMERLSLLGAMTGGIAHELNNFLNPISSLVYLIQAEMEKILPFLINRFGLQTEDGQKCLTFMKNCGEKLSVIEHIYNKTVALADSIRKFCRKDDSVSHHSVSVVQCIEESLKLTDYALKHNITVLKNIEPELPPVFGNPLQLEQIFINLFMNAAHAIKSVKKGTLEITAASYDSSVRIIVEDTGPGIPDDKLETIWEPFFTTRDAENGTGLGLFICREIIKEHGGSIRAENRDKGGARFIIELPVNHVQQSLR